MINPWLELSSKAPYVLPMDKVQVEAFSSRQKPNAQVQLNSIPEPFIGNPDTARVVLLLLNPGHDNEDANAHCDPKLKRAMFRNLNHEPQDYPFYPLNPAFSWTPTAKWWRPRTRKLREATGLTDSVFSERLLAIEWFPYHSLSSGLPTTLVCASQDYTFELARNMMKKKPLVIRMRSKNHWQAVNPQFGSVEALKNPRRSYISPGNTAPGVFEMIVKALTRAS